MKPKKNVLWIILAIVLLNTIGMSVAFPLLPFLKSLIGRIPSDVGTLGNQPSMG